MLKCSNTRKNSLKRRSVDKNVSKMTSVKEPKTVQGGSKVRNFIAAIGVVASVAGVMAANDCGKDENASEMEVSKLTPTPENLDKYVPPKGGVIKRKRFFPGVSKTVIFLPEMHKASTSVGGVLSRKEKAITQHVHEEKYLIIADLIEKFGGMPIVLEAWEKEKNRADATIDPQYQFPVLKRLLSITDRSERIRYGRKIVAQTGLPVFLVALFVFGEELPPIGPVSRVDAQKTDAHVQRIRDFVNILSSRKPIYQTPFGGRSYKVDEVLDGFDTEGGEEVVIPYCSLREMKKRIASYLENRVELVPKLEVKAATDLPEQTVIISTGRAHNKKAVEELDRTKNANYIVISPVSLDQFVTSLEEKEKNHQFTVYSDSVSGDCERLVESNPELLQQTIRDMVNRVKY